MGLGSEIRDPEKSLPDPGFRGQKGTGSRIPYPGSGSATLASLPPLLIFILVGPHWFGCPQRDGEYSRGPTFGGFVTIPQRGRRRTTGLEDYRVQEYRLFSSPSIKCNLLRERESLSEDSQNIPCASLKKRGSWVISIYLWLSWIRIHVGYLRIRIQEHVNWRIFYLRRFVYLL